MLTREQIESLEVGKEMDWEVAKLMGIREDLFRFAYEAGNYKYSTDISAAWEVFERLIEKHSDATLTYPWCIAADYNPMREETLNIHCEGETAPEVICRAALLTTIQT